MTSRFEEELRILPDRRKHRSAAPGDDTAFGAANRDRLNLGVNHLSALLGAGYGSNSALSLVGNRFQLSERQRRAVSRASCSDRARKRRQDLLVEAGSLAARRVAIDGFNVLTTVESALGGGVVLICRDGYARDMASLHGSWRRVEETRKSLELITARLLASQAQSVTWYLDRPVSNSGRLRGFIEEEAERQGLRCEVELVPDPDVILRRETEVVVSADSGILDHCSASWNLAAEIVRDAIPEAWVLSLTGDLDGVGLSHRDFDASSG